MGANGGVLESVSSTTNTQGSYGGIVTGLSSAPLVIRSGISGIGGLDTAFNLSIAVLTGFNGNVVLASAINPAPIILGASALPSGSNTITVPKGIAFGGAAVKSGGSYSNNAKFITDYDSIYVVTASDTAPNLSSTGFNRDIAVGLNGTALTGYTFPSTGLNMTNYRIVPLSPTTISTAVFTDGTGPAVSRSLSIAPRRRSPTATPASQRITVFLTAIGPQ